MPLWPEVLLGIFTDANCSTTLSGTPPGSPLRPAVACPAIPTPEASDWCAEAIRVVVGGREPTVCDGLGSCPELPTGGWNYGAADFQCINFPSATSPMWTPVKLVPGAAPGSLVPACMSADSSACIKTSLAGCEHLALRGSAIGTVPYVACTEEYAVAVKMRRDGKSWCRRARSTLRFHMYLDPALAGMAGVKAQ
ncbi:hypothetical protein DFJ74DRAFT_704785 [Hyaloraphidium curvatum]|nr:hypothetical protein DFJ74DRAFT_704785 [Hyaloraphidium curvatum]